MRDSLIAMALAMLLIIGADARYSPGLEIAEDESITLDGGFVTNASAISFNGTAPTDTTGRLYNDSGTLKFNSRELYHSGANLSMGGYFINEQLAPQTEFDVFLFSVPWVGSTVAVAMRSDGYPISISTDNQTVVQAALDATTDTLVDDGGRLQVKNVVRLHDRFDLDSAVSMTHNYTMIQGGELVATGDFPALRIEPGTGVTGTWPIFPMVKETTLFTASSAGGDAPTLLVHANTPILQDCFIYNDVSNGNNRNAIEILYSSSWATFRNCQIWGGISIGYNVWDNYFSDCKINCLLTPGITIDGGGNHEFSNCHIIAQNSSNRYDYAVWVHNGSIMNKFTGCHFDSYNGILRMGIPMGIQDSVLNQVIGCSFIMSWSNSIVLANADYTTISDCTFYEGNVGNMADYDDIYIVGGSYKTSLNGDVFLQPVSRTNKAGAVREVSYGGTPDYTIFQYPGISSNYATTPYTFVGTNSKIVS